MELLVHGCGIGPELRIQVHLTHFGVIEPIHHHDIGREMAVAIPLRHVQHFLLAGVALLTLDVSICRLGQHRRGSRQQPVSSVNLIHRGSGNHEERNPVAHLRGPLGLLVESGFNGGFRGIVPHQAITLVGDQERYAKTGRGRCRVIGPAADRVPAMIEETLVILAKSIVVLVVGRGECGAHHVELGVRGAAVAIQIRRSILVIGHRLRPAGQLKQCLALGCAQRNVRIRSGTREKLGNVLFRLERGMGRRQILVYRRDHPPGLVDVSLFRLACAPARVRGRRDKPVSRCGQRRFPRQAQSDSQDVRRVGFKDNGAAVPFKGDAALLSLHSHAEK